MKDIVGLLIIQLLKENVIIFQALPFKIKSETNNTKPIDHRQLY